MLSEIETVRKKIMNNATDEYDAVISLGGSCAAALNMRKRELLTYAYPFDYCFCVDAKYQFEILSELFKTDFKKWLKKENIVPLSEKEKGISDLYQYKDKYTEFRYIHDFKLPIEENGVYEEFYNKYTRRLKRMYQKIEASKKILFVSDNVRELSIDDIKKLKDTLNEKWKNKIFDFSVIIFNIGEDKTEIDEGIKIVKLKRRKNNYDFFGMNYEWGTILDNVKLINTEKNKINNSVKKYKPEKKFIKNKDVFFITGCSSGFGKTWCEVLLKQGFRVVATSRNVRDIEKLQKKYPKNCYCLELDVTNKKQVKTAIKSAIKKFGQIDVVLNNAGIGYFGIVENIKRQNAKKVFEVNYFGTINVIQAALPHFRKRHSGIILNTSSAAVYKAAPTGSIYASSKSALESMSESLKNELQCHNIKVCLLEYGETESNFYKNSYINKKVFKGYDNMNNILLDKFDKSEYNYSRNPKIIVESLVKTLSNLNYDEIPFRILIGNDTVKSCHYKINELSKDLQYYVL